MPTSDRRMFLHDPNWLPSLETLYGWHSQFDRMLRWYERLNSDQSLDVLLAFFLNCFALRDWLKKSGAMDGKLLDELISGNYAMKLCRDLCNRSKHLTLDKPSVDAKFVITREYRGKTRPAGTIVLAGGIKSDLNEIAASCVAFWKDTLRTSGLLD